MSGGRSLNSFPTAAEALAPDAFAVGQRVVVDWGEGETHTARVLELHTELCAGKPALFKVRVEYEADGQRLWHEPHRYPIQPAAGDDNGGGEEAWQRLPLRCCYSHERLNDPARGAACLHLPMCNFDALTACVARSQIKACPVAGCKQILRRRDAIVRDDAIRQALASLPESAQACWLRGTEVRLEAPSIMTSSSQSRTATGKRRRGEGEGGARSFTQASTV